MAVSKSSENLTQKIARKIPVHVSGFDVIWLLERESSSAAAAEEKKHLLPSIPVSPSLLFPFISSVFRWDPLDRYWPEHPKRLIMKRLNSFVEIVTMYNYGMP